MKYPDQLIANYLAGECSEAEASELNRWRLEKAEHEIHFKKIEAMWMAGEIPTENFSPDLETAREAIHQRIAQKEISLSDRHQTSRTLNYYVTRIAASLLIITVAALGYYFYNTPIDRMASVQTDLASKREILLPDGSTVWLNGQSHLTYPENNGTGTREVYLDGEAYFEVAKNAARPFLIHTGTSVTQVIGTSFNIRSSREEEEITVTVASGLVSFYEEGHPEKKVLLGKDERGVLEKNSDSPTKEHNIDRNFLSWKTNQIVFDNTPLAVVAATLERHFHKRIRIDQSLSRCRFTSNFTNETLDDILQELELIVNISIHRQDDIINLSGPSCQ